MLFIAAEAGAAVKVEHPDYKVESMMSPSKK